MGSFLENIIKNAGLGSILGGAASQGEGGEGGSLQDILKQIGAGDGNFDTTAVTGEDETEEVEVDQPAAGGINLQDILGQLGGAVAGGNINLQDILGKLGAGKAVVADEEVAEEEVEEVEEEAEAPAAGGINLQDILGKVLAGGGLGSLATGAINIINIAKSVFGNRAGVMAEQNTDDGFEEVK